MMDRAKLLSELRRDEGSVSYAYQDSKGYLTIGVGRLVDKRKGGGLTSQEIDYLLDNDVKTKEAELDRKLPKWRTLDDVRQRVILNMAFNLGVDGLLAFKNTLAAIWRKDYKTAAAQMLDSKWASDVGDRATRLARMMEYGN